MDEATQVGRVVDELAAAIGDRRYRTWFDGRVTLALGGSGDLRVAVGSPLERDCLQRQFGAELQTACLRAGAGNRRVLFHVDPAAEATPNPSAARPAAVRPQRQSPPANLTDAAGQATAESSNSSRRAVPPTQANPSVGPARAGGVDAEPAAAFDAFVAGAGNRHAVRIAQQVAAGQRVASPLVVWGPTGVGKTHLLRAIQAHARRCRRRDRVIYLTAEQFTTGFVDALHGRGLPGFRNKHRGVDLLLLDDLQFFAGKKRTLEELQHTLDTLTAAGAQIVLASDRQPTQLQALGAEIVSRLGAGFSVGVEPADTAMRRTLLHRMAAERGLTLQPHVAEIIATGVTSGARELSGVVHRLAATQQLLGEPVDTQLARSVVSELNRQTTPRLELADIQSAVCRVFGVDRQVLLSNRRTRATTEPRMVAMWLSRKYTRAAWSEIGEFYGRRSHSTVISACRRVDQLIGPDAPPTAADGAGLQDTLRLVEAELRTA
ncbi:MAG: DnaA/Hda family protein [Planctomycetota bacterium]